jgi:hypothetical protein
MDSKLCQALAGLEAEVAKPGIALVQAGGIIGSGGLLRRRRSGEQQGGGAGGEEGSGGHLFLQSRSHKTGARA